MLVCTHNDADHADGVLGYLEAGLRCEEVWLPGSWTGRLDDLLLDPARFEEELFGGVAEIASDASDLEELSSHLKDNDPKRNVESRPVDEQAPRAAIEGQAGKRNANTIGSLLDLGLWSQTWPNLRRTPSRLAGLTAAQRFLLIDALAAGERIRRIALAAHAHGHPIRWLKYGDGSYDAGPLSCINAGELIALPDPLPALWYLSLTVQNKESLVCRLAGDQESPPVLLTADSDLSFPERIPWERGMVITAPHHGSDANSAAYDRFAMQCHDPVCWVRSDGWYSKRPGARYLGLPMRYCTRCRPIRKTQEVLFSGRAGVWHAKGSIPCACTVV